MGMGVFQQKEPKKCQAPIKLAQPFPAPELRKFYGHHAFSEIMFCRGHLLGLMGACFDSHTGIFVRGEAGQPSQKTFCFSCVSGTRLITTSDRNLQFRGAISTGCFESSPSFAPCSAGKAPQGLEKVAKVPGAKSCHICCCHH